MTNQENKQQAQSMFARGGNVLLLIAFIYIFLSGISSSLMSNVNNSTDFLKVALVSLVNFIITTAVTIFLVGPLDYGWCTICYKIYNYEVPNVKAEDLFDGFKIGKDSYLRIVKATAWITLKEFLWGFWNLGIGSIVMALAYSQTFYLLKEQPNLNWKEACELSRSRMNGEKTRLFSLMFSYIGLILLCVLTLGIYSLWVEPRMQLSVFIFHKELFPEEETSPLTTSQVQEDNIPDGEQNKNNND